jgi:hypothetical protein
MVYSKEQLIEMLAPELAARTGSKLRDARNVLATYTVGQLDIELTRQRRARTPEPVQPPSSGQSDQEILDRISAEGRRQFENDPERIRQQQQHDRELAEVQRDYHLTQLFMNPVPGHGFPIRSIASEAIILGWLNPGETLNREFLVRIIAENPALAAQLQWRSINPKQAEAKELELDKQTFANAARTLRSFGVNEANFSWIRQVLGSGFSLYGIQQALASNALSLAPATQEELDQWAAEDIEAHNEALLRANPEELRARVRQESEQTRAASAQVESDRQLQAEQQREAPMGFPSLPADITRERIRAASPSEIKLWMRKYGQFQLNKILSGAA